MYSIYVPLLESSDLLLLFRESSRPPYLAPFRAAQMRFCVHVTDYQPWQTQNTRGFMHFCGDFVHTIALRNYSQCTRLLGSISWA